MRCTFGLDPVASPGRRKKTKNSLDASYTLHARLTPSSYDNHTYQNSKTTAAKKPSHTRQPTPVRSAMRSMRFMVPRSRTRVRSKESFIESAKADEERISSPMATVICDAPARVSSGDTARRAGANGGGRSSLAVDRRGTEKRGGGGGGGKGETHVLERPHARAHAFDLLVVLALQLAEHGVAVLAPGAHGVRISHALRIPFAPACGPSLLALDSAS